VASLVIPKEFNLALSACGALTLRIRAVSPLFKVSRVIFFLMKLIMIIIIKVKLNCVDIYQ
jgi:hypothetical protein